MSTFGSIPTVSARLEGDSSFHTIQFSVFAQRLCWPHCVRFFCFTAFRQAVFSPVAYFTKCRAHPRGSEACPLRAIPASPSSRRQPVFILTACFRVGRAGHPSGSP